MLENYLKRLPVLNATLHTHRLPNNFALKQWTDENLPACAKSVCVARSEFQPTETENQSQLRSRRQTEFDAGRLCAHALLKADGEQGTVTAADDRSPVWPTGFCGSISHSDNWVWAVTSKTGQLESIGIDTEEVVSVKTMELLSREILTDAEWETVTELVTEKGLDEKVAFTIAFSAKEAFYKCWYQTNPKFFGFKQATIETCDGQRIRIASHVANPNYQTQPAHLDVRYFVDGDDVFTATWMEPRG